MLGVLYYKVENGKELKEIMKLRKKKKRDKAISRHIIKSNKMDESEIKKICESTLKLLYGTFIITICSKIGVIKESREVRSDFVTSDEGYVGRLQFDGDWVSQNKENLIVKVANDLPFIENIYPKDYELVHDSDFCIKIIK